MFTYAFNRFGDVTITCSDGASAYIQGDDAAAVRKAIDNCPLDMVQHFLSAYRDIMDQSAGARAYMQDCILEPNYHDGRPRPQWDELGQLEKESWERNPTIRASL